MLVAVDMADSEALWYFAIPGFPDEVAHAAFGAVDDGIQFAVGLLVLFALDGLFQRGPALLGCCLVMGQMGVVETMVGLQGAVV